MPRKHENEGMQRRSDAFRVVDWLPVARAPFLAKKRPDSFPRIFFLTADHTWPVQHLALISVSLVSFDL